jgi:Fuc2NAc and GlcNAc transferase
MNPAIAWIVGISFVASYGALKRLIPWLSSRMLDLPNSRSSHFVPTPRGGGVVFVALSSLVAFGSLGLHLGDIVWVPLVALPLAVVGWADDRLNLPVLSRFFVQLATGLVLVGLSPLPFAPFATIIVVISAVAVINFTNFMDGLDGLLASCMAVSLATAAIKLQAPFPIWSLIGALLGFLFWNWSPAKVFMGDVGSTFLGAVFFGLVLQSTNYFQAFSLFLVLAPLLGDASLTLFRRLAAGQPVFQAHRQHLFQRLNKAGWSHARVTYTYFLATALLALAVLAFDIYAAVLLLFFQSVVACWLEYRVAVPFHS